LNPLKNKKNKIIFYLEIQKNAIDVVVMQERNREKSKKNKKGTAQATSFC